MLTTEYMLKAYEFRLEHGRTLPSKQLSRREVIAGRIKYNLRETKKPSDIELKINSANERNNLNVVYFKKATDPLYRKLSKLIGEANDYRFSESPHWNKRVSIRVQLEDFRENIENRSMNRETYSWLLKTSAKEILEELANY